MNLWKKPVILTFKEAELTENVLAAAWSGGGCKLLTR